MSLHSRYFINEQKPQDTSTLLAHYPALNSREMYTFHQTLEGYAPSPLYTLPQLATQLGIGELWLKYDAERFGLNAFKGLGASYAIYKYLQNNPGRQQRTFCTATDGNHGRAVAWAARLFGHQAVVFVPSYTVEERIENIRKQGAQVTVVEGVYDDAVERSAQEAKKNGWIIIQDTAWPEYTQVPEWIMAGYLTSMIEMEEQLLPEEDPAFDLILLQAGVGSWPAAILWYLMKRYGNKRPKTVCVEPLEADGLLVSARSGKITTSEGNCQTIMAGLNCRTPSMTAFPILKAGIDVFLAIPDEYASQAIRALYANDPPILAGESGVAGLAGLLALCQEDSLSSVRKKLQIDSDSRALVICTEGVTDLRNFHKIIQKC
jgi:diaminopropionate ammonia-lyase